MIVKFDEVDSLARKKEAMLAEKGGHHNQRPNEDADRRYTQEKRQPGQYVEQVTLHMANGIKDMEINLKSRHVFIQLCDMWYLLTGVDLAEYRNHMRRWSEKWATVCLPAAAFRDSAWPIDQWL